ncbi:MAG: hypothetical protein M3Z06_12665 [Actinomycetota bacterium]|nr:hypothetical protein [Actinomycetota bacterium]
MRRWWPGPRAAVCLIALVCLSGAGAAGNAPGAEAARNAPGDVEVIQTTTDLAQRMARLPDVRFGRLPILGGPTIHVDESVGYQRITGFGAAMTDSSAWLIEHEPASSRDGLMKRLFGTPGIRLNFLRLPIGASDFTAGGRPYTYDDTPHTRSDRKLTRFSIRHDRAYILPALRELARINPHIDVLASPWTAPAWMKGNRSLDNRSGRGTLRTSAYRAYAQYFVKFLRAYARAGVRIAAITPQNEPTSSTLYPGLDFPAGREARWILRDLRPALAKARLYPLIYGADGGWGPQALAYARATVAGPAVGALAGIAWHCYFGTPDRMLEMHASHPRLDQIVDECSPGITPFPVSEVVIASLRDWASTVALWNLALDPAGGPVQPPNSGCTFCTGLTTIDEITGAVSFGLSYYQLGQASAFIHPGAQRVSTGNFVSYAYTRPGADLVSPGLDDVAVRNLDGSIVLLTYNGAPSPITFVVTWRGRSFAYTLPPGAMATFIWNR